MFTQINIWLAQKTSLGSTTKYSRVVSVLLQSSLLGWTRIIYRENLHLATCCGFALCVANTSSSAILQNIFEGC